jgi:tRNA (guanine-N7-)-methyltransferase
MPHIFVESSPTPTLPCSVNGVDFEFVATYKNEEKISLSVDGERFLLSKKEKDGKDLIKVDKVTRVPKIEVVKKALNSYVKLTGNAIISSNTAPKKEIVEDSYEFLKDIDYFVNKFEVPKKLAIEVGFGSGRHLIYQAQKNPDKLYIGIEVHYPSIKQMVTNAKLQNLSNIIAIKYDARLLLEFIESNCVDEIFVHFPVPWDKKPHRRVMSDEFIQEATRVLKVNGFLHLRTDSINYFEYTLGLVANLNRGHIEIDINRDIEISSKYEDRWKRQEKNIYDVMFYAKDESPKLELDGRFLFGKVKEHSQFDFEHKPMIEGDFFLHIKKPFEIEGGKILLSVTMGDFNKPLNKYILIDGSEASYYQSTPIATKSNIKAHQLLNRILCD